MQMLGIRGEAMKKLFYGIALILVAAWVIGKLSPDTSENSSDSASGIGPATSVNASSPAASQKAACDVGSPASGAVVAVTGDYELRTTPSESGARIKNEKASSILKKTLYHRIDSSTTVKQTCVDGDWSEVQIVTPEWLTFVRGWVPNNVLRDIERTAGGTRVYVEEDFFWDRDTSKYKKQIVAVTNKIAREHTGCAILDAGTIALSPSRSKPKDPVFFVTCNPSSGVPFNVWFRPSDSSKTFAAVKPISRGDATIACEQAAKAAATHPSTVDFSTFLDVAYSAREDGRVALDSSFTAKNSFNLELKYRIRCVFDGQTLIESSIAEAG